MNKIEIYELLKSKDVWHEITEHVAVYNMAEVAQLNLPYPEADAKNLFVRDKKKNFFLITVKGDRRVDLKEFKEKNGLKSLSFASEESLEYILGVISGAVSPFGLLNDSECKVQFYIDKELLQRDGVIGIHPNDNTATVWIKTEDLISLIEEHGNQVHIVSL